MKLTMPIAAFAGLAVLLSSSPSKAEENVFLSLTRSSEPARSMPTNISVITSKEIQRSGAVSLADALAMLPSVEVLKPSVPGQFSTVRMRGAPSPDDVQVVVDDQPQGGVFLQEVDIGQISADDIDRIEVVRGGASALYGPGGTGGIIHVFTKKSRGDRPFTSLGYELRSFGTRVQRAEVRLPEKHSDFHFNATTYRTKGFQENSDGNGFYATGGAGHTFSNGGKISLEASRMDNEAGDPQGTPIPFDQLNGHREKEPVNPLSREDHGNTQVRTRATVLIGADVSLETVFFVTLQDDTYDDPAQPIHNVVNKNVMGNDTRLFLPDHWLAGVSYERDEYRFAGSPKLYGVDWGGYLQKILAIGPINLIPAIRFDQPGIFGHTYNPRLTAVWQAMESLKMSANVGRSFRSPALTAMTQSYPPFPPNGGLVLANPQLRPETAWSYDMGAQFSPSTTSTLSVTGFNTRIRDEITSTNNFFPTSDSFINVPRAEITGVETEAVGRWGSLVHRVNYTFQHAVEDRQDSSKYVPIRQTPRHLVHARLTWEAPYGWELTGGLDAFSRQFNEEGNQGTKARGHTTLNARIAKTILGAELFLAEENLENRHYADAFRNGALVPQPGRTICTGVTLRFNG